MEPFVQITEAVPRRKNHWIWKWCGFFCGSLSLARIHKHLMGCTFKCKFEQQVQRYPFRGCGWCCCSCSRKKKDPNSIRGLHSRDLPAHSSLFVKRWKKQRNDTHRVSQIFSHSGPSFEPVTTTANSHAKRHCKFFDPKRFLSGEAFACAKAGLPSGGISLGVGGFFTSDQQLRPPIQHRDLKVENILKALGTCGKVHPATLSKRSNVRMICRFSIGWLNSWSPSSHLIKNHYCTSLRFKLRSHKQLCTNLQKLPKRTL